MSADEARRRGLGPFRGLALWLVPCLACWSLIGWQVVSRLT